MTLPSSVLAQGGSRWVSDSIWAAEASTHAAATLLSVCNSAPENLVGSNLAPSVSSRCCVNPFSLTWISPTNPLYCIGPLGSLNSSPMSSPSQAAQSIAVRVEKIAAQTPIIDIHTHLYDAAFGELLLWGIDDLLTYHYLVAEGFRYFDFPYDKFWAMSKAQQAERIWDALFI